MADLAKKKLKIYTPKYPKLFVQFWPFLSVHFNCFCPNNGSFKLTGQNSDIFYLVYFPKEICN